MQRAAFKVALSAIAVAAAFASTAHAAGFMLTEQSAGSLGRAYAGAGVDGTDLSGVYYNPATMVLHKGTALQAGFVGIGLNLDYAGEDGTTANGRNKSQAIPHGYFVHQINDKVWFGLGMTVPFGMGTEYDDDWAGNQHGISATILTFDLNPNFAFKLNEKFSVGFGASIQYAQADLKIRKSLQGKIDSPISGESEIDADSIAWGWNVGMMWSPTETSAWAFLIVPRSSMTPKVISLWIVSSLIQILLLSRTLIKFSDRSQPLWLVITTALPPLPPRLGPWLRSPGMSTTS